LGATCFWPSITEARANLPNASKNVMVIFAGGPPGVPPSPPLGTQTPSSYATGGSYYFTSLIDSDKIILQLIAQKLEINTDGVEQTDQVLLNSWMQVWNYILMFIACMNHNYFVFLWLHLLSTGGSVWRYISWSEIEEIKYKGCFGQRTR
jgi:hypothetical protein